MAKELGRAYPELGDEFALTAIELSFLTERKDAFNNLAYRVDLESVQGVVTTMVQTERYGTPLASALRVLSAEFRNERMMRAEEKAARLPAIMTIPLILFILPVLFIVILGPAACSISDAFCRGRSGQQLKALQRCGGGPDRNRPPHAFGFVRPRRRSARFSAIEQSANCSRSSSEKCANSRASIARASGMIRACTSRPASVSAR